MTPEARRMALALLSRHEHCRELEALAAGQSQLTAMTSWAIKADKALRELRSLIETGALP